MPPRRPTAGGRLRTVSFFSKHNYYISARAKDLRKKDRVQTRSQGLSSSRPQERGTRMGKRDPGEVGPSARRLLQLEAIIPKTCVGISKEASSAEVAKIATALSYFKYQAETDFYIMGVYVPNFSL